VKANAPKAFNPTAFAQLLKDIEAKWPEAVDVVGTAITDVLAIFAASPPSPKPGAKDALSLQCDNSCKCGECLDCSIDHQVKGLACSIKAKCCSDCPSC
jgi:hypothetical protein